MIKFRGLKQDFIEFTKDGDKTLEEVINDINLGLDYNEIREKYTISVLNNLYYRGLLPNLFSKFLKERNQIITDEYKKVTAKTIIESDDDDLKNPNKIQTLTRVYGIACEGGFKKFPKIGNRQKGGTFEDKKILRYIQKKRDKDGWTFRRISEKLIKLGHRTLTGKEFSIANVNYKYYAYKKSKNKRLSYD